jgi:hypothetical protein
MDKKNSISAEVILKSKTGKSMIEIENSLTSKNIHEFEPPIENTKIVVEKLKELGFEVYQNQLTLTIIGDAILFEKIFIIALSIKRNKKNIISVNPDKEPTIPQGLSGIVEKIVFPPAARLFNRYYAI